MNKQIIVLLALFALVACVAAQYGGYGYEKKEKKFIQLPIPKIKINLDKLTLPIPDLSVLFQTHQEHQYPQYGGY